MKRLAILVVAFTVVVACSRATTPPVRVASSKSFDPSMLRRLAVTPVHTVGDTSDTEPKATEELFEILVNAASAGGRWTVLDPDRVAVEADKVDDRNFPRAAGRIAQSAGADAALTATISHWHERVGSGYGASEPASVALRVLLIPAGQVQPTWTAEYAITQEPLTYNLWNFWGVLRGGPKWLTAPELAKIGVDEAVKRLAATSP